MLAVDALSFEGEKGELFGIIAPDGAGETTGFRMLCTLLLPDSDNAWVDGYAMVKDYLAIRHKVGYMPGKFSLYHDLTVEENLVFFASIFGASIEENYELIRDIYVQIEPFRHRKAGKLSGGMKQKLALCCALIHRPAVLFLDEPTTGVDAVSRKEFWEMLQRLKQNGITILVSTPYMDEASLCDRVILMQHARSMTSGSPAQIIAQFYHPLLAIKAERMFSLLNDLGTYPELEHVYAYGEYHHAVMKNDYSEEALRSFLQEKGQAGIEILPVQPAIEDCFLQLMR